MKLISVFFPLLVYSVHCFLNFSPSGENADSFLDTIKVTLKDIDDENDFMGKAVNGEFCNRDCRVDDSRVCHFKFMIKHYQVMSG